MKPQLNINIENVKHNTRELVRIAHENNMTVAGITKGCCGNESFALAQVEAGVDYLADSRIENLIKLQHLPVEKMLLRSPKLSEVEDVVRYAQYSLNSEFKIIEALSSAAMKLNTVHQIILMIDMGDLREGIWFEDEVKIHQTITKTLKLQGVELVGIGVNLTCFGGVIPSVANYGYIVELAKNIRSIYNIPLPIVSGGNSSSLQMLYSGEIPKGINHLRINQSLYLGYEIAHGHALKDWKSDVISLRAEIIEIQTKPSFPMGEFAKMNAFGAIKNFPDKGVRTRAILAIGRQDLNIEGLKAMDPHITIEGGSSDHLIIDITDSKINYEVGEWINFHVTTYSTVLTAMASNYIDKVTINENIQCY